MAHQHRIIPVITHKLNIAQFSVFQINEPGQFFYTAYQFGYITRGC